ncbi:MAG: hypothetical protein AAF328_01155 [Planctomycetota bacterium]
MTSASRDYWQADDDALARPWIADARALLGGPGHDAALRARLLRFPDRAWEVVASIIARAAAGDDPEACEVAADLLQAWPLIRTGQHVPPEPKAKGRHRVRL